jgi:hypothetical protein
VGPEIDVRSANYVSEIYANYRQPVRKRASGNAAALHPSRTAADEINALMSENHLEPANDINETTVDLLAVHP